MSRKRQRARRFIVLGVAVATLTFIALWRVAAPRQPAGPAPAPGGPPRPLDTARGQPPAMGRPIVVEAAEIREVPSPRTLWVQTGGDVRFAVLDPDVKRQGEVTLQPGSRVTLVGLVRPVPRADVAVRQWRIDEAMAARVAERGDYVYVTEIR